MHLVSKLLSSDKQTVDDDHRSFPGCIASGDEGDETTGSHITERHGMSGVRCAVYRSLALAHIPMGLV